MAKQVLVEKGSNRKGLENTALVPKENHQRERHLLQKYRTTTKLSGLFEYAIFQRTNVSARTANMSFRVALLQWYHST